MPCQYWQDGRWYDLSTLPADYQVMTSVDPSGTTTGDDKAPYTAVWTFCKTFSSWGDQVVSDITDTCSSLTSSDLNEYALIANYPKGSECQPASTSNWQDITQSTTEINGESQLVL